MPIVRRLTFNHRTELPKITADCNYWAKDALAAKDLGIEEAEALYGESALVAC